ncbi:MAG TPA: biotin carboxylase N-terminal domain-containing protein [Polyangiaceae bacterium]|nr:biotin carboxylase N-terminal domain-containing protein [Polyangiaceae bacterium]
MFRKVLIANRGEIAIRIARTLREEGIASVGVFTEADHESPFIDLVDEAVELGANARAYLDVDAIVGAARRVGANALHPGYGFLSENADLAEACEQAQITFVGPSPRAIRAMGSKQRARQLMSQAGVPIVPGGDADTFERARESAARVGYPVLLKATDGGGGKGMRRVDSEAELAAALERTQSEAEASFGSRRVHVEKALLNARHVEIQVLGDRHGRLVHLYERDCSMQRRHQKIIEETPCPVLPEGTLDRMAEVALAGARALGYYSAGTFEFLLDASGEFYFLEMNTRLQVEHPITELVTGLDLVREMLRIAAGQALPDELPARRGAAIEARIYAEEPARGFLPSPGRISHLREPSGPFVRIDSAIRSGTLVGTDYDPLLAKLSVWAPDRETARRRLLRALSEYRVGGLQTNLGYLMRLVQSPAFVAGEYDTRWVESNRQLWAEPALSAELGDALSAAICALESQSSNPERTRSPTVSGTSPWVLQERARLR